MTIMLEIPKVINQKIRKALDLIKEHFNNYPQLNENNKISTSLIDVDSSNRFVTDAEKSTWNGKNINIMSGDKVDSNYLPSYVDDVLEYANLASFPLTGETGKIYIALDTNLSYRWTGSNYTLVGGDPSLFQLKSEKNQANGYTGANANGKSEADQIESKLEIIKYNTLATATDKTDLVNTGNTGTSYSATGIAYLTSDTYLYRPTLNIAANQANVGRYINFTSAVHRCNTPYGLYLEALITCDTGASVLSHDVFIGWSNASGLISTTNASGTYGLFLRRNPTLNSGKWQAVRINNGTFTVIHLDTAWQGDKTPILAKIIYNKYTETAYFYLDNILVHTMSDVNLPNNTNFYSFFDVYQNLVADTFAKNFSLISIKEGLKKYA